MKKQDDQQFEKRRCFQGLRDMQRG